MKELDSLSMDLDVAQKECRNASSELFRVKSAYEESILQLDEVRKENKNLSNEIKDIIEINRNQRNQRNQTRLDYPDFSDSLDFSDFSDFCDFFAVNVLATRIV